MPWKKIKILLPWPFTTSVVYLSRKHQRKLPLLWIIPSSSSNEYHGVCEPVISTWSARQILWLRFIVLFSGFFQKNVSRSSCNTPKLLPFKSFQFCREQIIYNLTLRNLLNSKSSLNEPRINNDFLIIFLYKRWPIFVFLHVCLLYDASQLCRLFAVKGSLQWILPHV